MKNIKRILAMAALVLLAGNVSAYAEETIIKADSKVGIYIPYGLVSLSDGVLMADNHGNRILKKSGNEIEVVAGKESLKGGYVDGKASEAVFNGVSDVAVSSNGEIFIADSENNGIRKVDKSGEVITWSGSFKAGYENGSRQRTQYNQPMGITIDKDNNIYVADTLNHVIRKIDKNGESTTIAGTPGKAGYVNGSTKEAAFNEPTDVAVDENGVIYVADSGNQCIRKIDGNTVTTLAGTPSVKNQSTGYYEGGYVNGYIAQFNFPRSLTLLGNGDLLVADTLNNAVRRVNSDGQVMTVADGLDEPVAVIAKQGRYYISERWKSSLKVI